MTITLNIAPELEQQLNLQASRVGLSTDGYITTVLKKHLQFRSEPTVSNREASLLQQLDLGLSETDWERYHQLIDLRRSEAISPDELTELIEFTDRLEAANAKRMVSLIELATLRGVSLDDLMRDLEITPRSHE